MLGQAHHFRIYAPEPIPYAVDRFTKETQRLYGVIDRRLADREFLAGAYSIADMATYPWAKLWQRQGQDLAAFPNLRRWLDAVAERPAVKRGVALNAADRKVMDTKDPAVRAALFGQGTR